ncbi:PP2C family protein-serine/threonine phosphatase [Streptomyces sp. NPDC005438]|uniref:PP2C family protein-serine/threonine phosphatase n=1 Tax=Streptomyces sp. NPDC005438 TaxID=3156880 RepID=UPI0033A959C0
MVLLLECGHAADGRTVPLLVVTPALACVLTARREPVLVSGVAVLLVLPPLAALGQPWEPALAWCTALAVCVVALTCWRAAGHHLWLGRELDQLREVASAAQQALLRPLPSRVDGLDVAVRHLSASRSAAVGGDLYEVVSTRYGVRVVIGDVRGHGLPALGTVAAVLGTFREAAHDEPSLDGVLWRLERGLARHLSGRAREFEDYPPLVGAAGGALGGDVALRAQESDSEEEFVTALLLEVRPDGGVEALNCGHPWPYRLGGEAAEPKAPGEHPGAEPSSGAEPLPPLGLFPLPEKLVSERLHLEPGEGLLLYTDGAPDARDVRGEFFPMGREVERSARCAADLDPSTVVGELCRALDRHSAGRLSDDVALLALRRATPRVPRQPAPTSGRARSRDRERSVGPQP